MLVQIFIIYFFNNHNYIYFYQIRYLTSKCLFFREMPQRKVSAKLDRMLKTIMQTRKLLTDTCDRSKENWKEWCKGKLCLTGGELFWEADYPWEKEATEIDISPARWTLMLALYFQWLFSFSMSCIGHCSYWYWTMK